MSKQSMQVQILTANRLLDGAVVFLNFDGDWVQSLAGVVIARAPDEARNLAARGLYDAGRNLVVEPYLVDVREVAGALLPLRQRERVRLSGPSIAADVPGYLEPTMSAPPGLERGPPQHGEAGNPTQPRAEPAGHKAASHAEAA
jgi:Protein of unknown function (DUF2849)